MPVTIALDVGVQNAAAGLTLCEVVEYEQRLDEVVVMDCDSGFGAGATFDPVVDITLRGKGDLPAGLVIGSDGATDGEITGLNDGASDVTIYNSIRESERNDDLNDWEASGQYFPNAT